MISVMWLAIHAASSADVEPLGEASLPVGVQKFDYLIAVSLIVGYKYSFHIHLRFSCFQFFHFVLLARLPLFLTSGEHAIDSRDENQRDES